MCDDGQELPDSTRRPRRFIIGVIAFSRRSDSSSYIAKRLTVAGQYWVFTSFPCKMQLTLFQAFHHISTYCRETWGIDAISSVFWRFSLDFRIVKKCNDFPISLYLHWVVSCRVLSPRELVGRETYSHPWEPNTNKENYK